MTNACNHDKRIDDNITLYSVHEYVHEYDCYLSQDKKSGFAIHRRSNELVNVFSLVGGRGADLISDAVQEGATNLNCFDGYLVRMYSAHGFRELRREPNWTEGGPDVVFMELEQ